MSETNLEPLRLLSIVVPVYGCEACIAVLCDRVDRVLKQRNQSYEMILVDDRSTERSWEILMELCNCYPNIKAIKLSRNFGQHLAITAGFAQSKGDYVIVMDCDLQDPPEVIPQLIDEAMKGYDIVFAKRISRTHSWFRQWASKYYFKLLNRLTEKNVDGADGSFSIVSRKVVESFLRFGERERHYLFILRWLGYKTSSINYEHADRYAGKSSYPLKLLIRHALDGLFFQATVLLKWIIKTGLLFAFSGVILAAYYIWQYLLYGSLHGWTTLVVLILLSTGTILTSLGVIGLYIGRIFEQIKQRPLFIIDTISGGSQTQD
ncbi:glycosyl transferase family 2 [Legionella quinlivanii]|uniref:Glycosyl transferase family 2 n=1 Tax=Legionella quinlivanii TaxID=45073 RepID=A0A0W0Y5L6_9GAMM|nr:MULTISPECIES: glycosyltransferase family 2 protein [Legionella]KTD51954.1 glycosyl transferase family 2 [Legionella quinlivanii]MCE3046349.1 glycosyltransferase family 2 protein [Legionella sp. 16cNR16C]MCW8452214.1 glycosyltransferase family 2 protein [Legionella quinlivanii]SEF85747.1 dolichol-phosphate mannosyltransferase [Legionella quinlivanii DSM 21216]STY09583.1 bactoprenol glucosyl transferase; CPS-53 (KpLE1) prophage [Legionella quinlivanii]